MRRARRGRARGRDVVEAVGAEPAVAEAAQVGHDHLEPGRRQRLDRPSRRSASSPANRGRRRAARRRVLADERLVEPARARLDGRTNRSGSSSVDASPRHYESGSRATAAAVHPAPMTPEEFRRHGHALIDWIADYLERIERSPVQPDVEPGRDPVDAARRPADRARAVRRRARRLRAIVLPGLTHWQHPGFFAYFPANSSYPSILGELLSAGLGVNGMSWVTSPACTEFETHVVDWMAELLDLPEVVPRRRAPRGGGVIQATASEATLTSILAARWRATGGRGERRRRGGDGDLVAYTTAAGPLVDREGSADRRHRHRPACASSRPTRRSRCDRTRSAEAIDRRPRRRAAARSGCAPRRGRRAPPRSTRCRPIGEIARRRRPVVPRRRCDERDRRAGTGAPLDQRRARARRQLLHQPAQVDGRQLRLRPVLDERPRGAARGAVDPARSTSARQRPRPARRSTTATGGSRSAAGSARSSSGSCCAATGSTRSRRCSAATSP